MARQTGSCGRSSQRHFIQQPSTCWAFRTQASETDWTGCPAGDSVGAVSEQDSWEQVLTSPGSVSEPHDAHGDDEHLQAGVRGEEPPPTSSEPGP